jgi:antitoxin component YwqK of YwqJK toxin-antitoxin module
MNTGHQITFTCSLLLLSCTCLIAQFQQIQWPWDSTETDQQIQYWGDGGIKAENKRLGDQLFRFQYYENGALQLKAAIQQHRGIDTIITFDPETLERSQIQYKRNFHDWPSGPYLEFFPDGNVKAKGEVDGKKHLGKWLEYWANGNLKREIHYDEKGFKAGPYREYYENGNLKVSGAYKVEMVTEKRLCFNPETFQEYECEIEVEQEVQTGEWRYYDESGKEIHDE